MNREGAAEGQQDRRSRVEAEIREVDAQIAALQGQRTKLCERLAGMKGAAASAATRKERAALRDQKIAARALEMKGRHYTPNGWLQQLAEEFDLSTRQIARVLEGAGVVVAPQRRRS